MTSWKWARRAVGQAAGTTSSAPASSSPQTSSEFGEEFGKAEVVADGEAGHAELGGDGDDVVAAAHHGRLAGVEAVPVDLA
ncbi:hypothetical protein [Streptomyces sp. 900105245]